MRDLAQQLRWYRAIEHKIAVKKLDFLHSLPSSDWGRARSWTWWSASVGV